MAHQITYSAEMIKNREFNPVMPASESTTSETNDVNEIQNFQFKNILFGIKLEFGGVNEYAIQDGTDALSVPPSGYTFFWGGKAIFQLKVSSIFTLGIGVDLSYNWLRTKTNGIFTSISTHLYLFFKIKWFYMGAGFFYSTILNKENSSGKEIFSNNYGWTLNIGFYLNERMILGFIGRINPDKYFYHNSYNKRTFYNTFTMEITFLFN
jgi:hypothetical protein